MDINTLYNQGKLRIPSYPLMFFLDLTECCNLRCWFCYNESASRRNMAKFNTIINILKIMSDAGCKEVIYLGGEPTLHPRLFDILDYAEGLGMRQGLVSNGQIIDYNFAKKLSKFKNIEIGISIHSNDEIIQNKIAGNINSFNKIDKAIDCLEMHGIHWYSQTSLIIDNFQYLSSLREYLLNKGRPTRMDLSRMVVGCKASEGFLSASDYEVVFQEINSMDTVSLPVRIEAFPRCWLKMISQKHNLDYDKIKKAVRPCYAWTAQLSIDIEGNVRLCPTGGKVAGNILQEGIDGIWKKNKIIQEFQSFGWQNKACLECSDFVYCVGACKMSNGLTSPTPDEYILKGGMKYAGINE